MKKIISIIIVVSMILTLTTVSYAANSITINASVDNATKMVTISGAISSGKDKEITVLVINPLGATDYINQTISEASGIYQFSYKLDEATGGVYTVRVGGTDVAPVETVFTFAPTDDTTAPVWPADARLTAVAAKTSVTLTWPASQDDTSVTGYKVYKGTELIASLGSDERAHYITFLNENTNYSFTVKAVDAAGNMSTGLSVIVKTLNATLPPDDDDNGGETKEEVKVGTDGRISAKPVLNKDNQAVTTLTSEDINNAAGKVTAGTDGIKVIPIEVKETNGANEYRLDIPSVDLTDDAEDRKYEIKTELGTITLPSTMLASAKGVLDSDYASLLLGMADKNLLDEDLRAEIGDKPVIEISLLINGKRTEWNNSEAPVKMSIPYTPTAEELADPEHIVVWYIDGEGNAVPVPNGKYDVETGMVTVTVTHFSKYAVAYVKKTFTDILAYPWAKDAIEVMASKGIINGTSATTYNPAASITRGDFIKLLIDALELQAVVDSNFSDVRGHYENQIGIAKKLGIVYGDGNNKAYPNANITRQDMMAIVERAMKAAGRSLKPGTMNDLAGYADKNSISPYVLQGVATLVKSGIISGSGNNINPSGYTTRAEIAVVIYKIYNSK